jgi:hypothetical protein
MVQVLEAVFDGEVLHPNEPLNVQPNTRVRLVVETMPERDEPPKSFLETARNLNLNGPADWSTNIDKYLYGDDAERGS